MINVNSLIESKKGGQFVSFKISRSLKVRKNGSPITKISEFIGRIGINYDNMKSVINKRESGELPSENQGLAWGVWKKFPYLIEHNGVEYLRVYPSYNGNPNVKYFRDGVEVSEETARAACLKSEFSDSSSRDCSTIKVDNIISAK